MSHDRGCFRCWEDHPIARAKKGICQDRDCPYKEKPVISERNNYMYGDLDMNRPSTLDAEIAHTRSLTSDIQRVAEVGMKESPRQHILKLSWDTVNTGIEALAYQIAPFKPRLLVGVARGGLIPTVRLSHMLNVPMATISAHSYEGTRRTLQKPTEIVGWDASYADDATWFIDDIVDTAETFYGILKKIHTGGRYGFASLISKGHTHIQSRPLTFFGNVAKDTWVKFPWEQD